MGRSRRRKKLPTEPVAATIESLSHDGRGVTHIEGKTVFIHGGLPGEEVMFTYSKKMRKFDEGQVTEVIKPSPERVEPACPHFGVCGGCSLQHQHPKAQLSHKQQTLMDALKHIGKVRPEEVLAPLELDDHWGYRRKARLGAKNVPKKGKVLVGFRERGSSFITDLSICKVLHPKVGELIAPLSELIESLSISDKVPQIEMAMGDEVCVLIFRVLETPSAEDCTALAIFSRRHGIHIYLQEGGPTTIKPLSGEAANLTYAIPDFDVELKFLPSDFTQVNSGINRLMVRRAIDMLELKSDDRVLELFCGLGNFTLPLAKNAGSVVAVEGDPGLVARARENAQRNGIENTTFYTANLYEELVQEPWLGKTFNKALLDPPRSGAFEILEYLPKLGVMRILYISCYPGTLARDAGELVHKHGYRLVSAGVMDMFPHTAHIESMALFERE
ncbi:23S rRNA (uracil(1939)-C(5))-methyltransferase [hydrothermal vent metagenome]|uniref:23S rRNA (Uracil(1939)-C(5))-methyltransferase n=1 Tax=hydrothermal vent metagenome TaxID=652676 RepID=A0A3B1AV74_9ZZZZ